MAVKTVNLDDLEKYVENIYEAIVIIAKRARQINEEQKRIVETEVAIEDEIDTYDDEEDEDELEKEEAPHYIKMPKPTTIALKEMLEGKINFEYIKREE